MPSQRFVFRRLELTIYREGWVEGTLREGKIKTLRGTKSETYFHLCKYIHIHKCVYIYMFM